MVLKKISILHQIHEQQNNNIGNQSTPQPRHQNIQSSEEAFLLRITKTHHESASELPNLPRV